MSHFGKYLLLPVAGMLLAACTALPDPVSPQETGPVAVVFAPEVMPTKSAFFDGASLEDAISGTYLPMFVSTVAHPSKGVNQTLFTAEKFSRDAVAPYYYKPASGNAMYWPLSGSLDYVAYAGFTTQPPTGPPAPATLVWNTTPSTGFVCRFYNTLEADTDLVWAAATGLTERNTAIPMSFKHAMAGIEVQIKVPVEGAGRMVVKKIEAKTGVTAVNLAGVFTVDNTLVVPEGRWTSLTPGLPNGLLWSGTATYDAGTGKTSMLGQTTGPVLAGATPVTFVRVFVPEQRRTQFVVTYSVDGGADVEKILNVAAGDWEAGKFYRYQFEAPTSLFP